MSNNLWVNVEDLGAQAESDYAYDACKTASFILWALSGRKFSGVTTVTERYVSQLDPYLRAGGSSLTYWPVLVSGSVVNTPVGSNSEYGTDFLGDGTSSRSRVRLRGRKVIKIHTVRDVDGNIIDPKHYYLAEHSTLYGSPNSSWSSASVEVTYTYGSAAPSGGRAAARLLASELVKYYEGDEDCALPARVTSVTRQGITATILDDQAFIDELKTGLYPVDLFLKAVNPDKARARARVFSPDTPRARRITPKSPAIPLSSYDLYVTPEGGATLYYLSEVNGDFLLDDSAWVVSAVVSDYYNDQTVTLDGAAFFDDVEGTIRVSAAYSDILSIIGPRDPGVLDIYATRPSLSNPLVDEIVNLVSSNVIFQLGERVVPIYTA